MNIIFFLLSIPYSVVTNITEPSDEEIKHEVHNAYLDSIAPFKMGVGYEVPGEFVIARGLVI